MNKQARSRKSTAKQSARLSAYLATCVTASMAAASSAEAAIVNINVGPSGFNITGVNGGLAPSTSQTVNSFPFLGGGNLAILNTANVNVLGLEGDDGLLFAIDGGYASPRNFSLGASIDSFANFSVATYYTRFRDGGDISPDFGPNSYMGFLTATGNYGWLEVTWASGSSQFQILSGAYEDQVGVAILAGQGAGPAAVPEPGAWAAAALLAGGATFLRWRRRRDEAQKEAA